MIVTAILVLLQSAPPSEDSSRVFPADRLVCNVAASPAAFVLSMEHRAGDARVRVKSTRDDAFPSGDYVLGRSFVTRRENDQPVDYRVGLSASHKAGEFSLNMQVVNGRPARSWLRLMPPGPYRSDRLQELGAAECVVKAD
ncbi:MULTISPECIES: hypothetical protein [unclassified Sphingomonas]|jgi:hypothetical protein|nr:MULTISPECIES: hypothetical protein [unclassified Sphingomonas]